MLCKSPGIDGAQVGLLGQELAEQAVGVLVEAPLPCPVGVGEEDVEATTGLKCLEAGELLPVVHGKGVTLVGWDPGQCSAEGGVERGRGHGTPPANPGGG